MHEMGTCTHCTVNYPQTKTKLAPIEPAILSWAEVAVGENPK